MRRPPSQSWTTPAQGVSEAQVAARLRTQGSELCATLEAEAERRHAIAMSVERERARQAALATECAQATQRAPRTLCEAPKKESQKESPDGVATGPKDSIPINVVHDSHDDHGSHVVHD